MRVYDSYILIKIEKRVKEELKRKARARGLSLSAYIRELLYEEARHP